MDFIRTNLLKINFVFVGRRLRVNYTLSISLTIILAILKLLQFSSINLIASTTTLSRKNLLSEMDALVKMKSRSRAMVWKVARGDEEEG